MQILNGGHFRSGPGQRADDDEPAGNGNTDTTKRRAALASHSRVAWIRPMVFALTAASLLTHRPQALAAELPELDLYKILGVRPDATTDEVRAAYNDQSVKWHPSHHSNPAARQRAEARYQKITQAYLTLSNPALRREYDSTRPQSIQREATTSRGRPECSTATPRRNAGSRTVQRRARGDESSSDSWSMCDDWFEDEDDSDSNPQRPSPGYRRRRRRRQPMPTDIFTALASFPLFPSDRMVLRACSRVTSFLHKALNSAAEMARTAGAKLLPNMLGKTTQREITLDEHGKLIERVSTFTQRRDGTTVIDTTDRRLTHEEMTRLKLGKELRPVRAFFRKASRVFTRIAMQLLAMYIVVRAWELVLIIHFFFS